MQSQLRTISQAARKVLAGEELSDMDAYELGACISEATDSLCEELYEAAHQITQKYTSRYFDTCSIVNVKSGNCSEDCKWCAQSGHYVTSAQKYSLLSPEQCTHQAVQNRAAGIGRFSLVAGGRTQSDREIEHLSRCYEQISQKSDIKLCASLGLLNKKQLRRLRQAGVTTYHCNMETAPSYFSSLCSTHTQEDKQQTLQWAREVGMQICSGGIIGMGETMQQRIEFALYLRSIGTRSIPINILQAIPGTPLQETPPISEKEYLKTVALFRFINPQAFLRFSGGRAQLSAQAMRKAIYIGINSAITGDLLTTIGVGTAQDMAMIKEMGFINSHETDWEEIR